MRRVELKTLRLNLTLNLLAKMHRKLAKNIWYNHKQGNIPIKVRGRDVIDGNKRILAAIYLGHTYTEVEDVVETA